MILRFVLDLAAPFTNNTTEQALRPVKLQQKISATWRLLHSLAALATVRSYLDTAAKHGVDASQCSSSCSPPARGCHQRSKLNTYVRTA
jgi:hypothetical protein